MGRYSGLVFGAQHGREAGLRSQPASPNRTGGTCGTSGTALESISRPLGHRGTRFGIYDPDRRLRHLWDRVRRDQSRRPAGVPAGHGGDGADRDQLWPHGACVPVGWLGLYLRIRDDSPQCRLRHRLVVAARLPSASPGQCADPAQLHGGILPGRDTGTVGLRGRDCGDVHGPVQHEQHLKAQRRVGGLLDRAHHRLRLSGVEGACER